MCVRMGRKKKCTYLEDIKNKNGTHFYFVAYFLFI